MVTWLREMRVNAQKTLRDVAQESGVSECYVSQIETGARRPSVEAAKKLAGVLGFPWTRFFEEG